MMFGSTNSEVEPRSMMFDCVKSSSLTTRPSTRWSSGTPLTYKLCGRGSFPLFRVHQFANVPDHAQVRGHDSFSPIVVTISATMLFFILSSGFEPPTSEFVGVRTADLSEYTTHYTGYPSDKKNLSSTRDTNG